MLISEKKSEGSASEGVVSHDRLPVHEEIPHVSFCPLKVLVVLQIHVNNLLAFVFAEGEDIIRFKDGGWFLLLRFNGGFADDADERPTAATATGN